MKSIYLVPSILLVASTLSACSTVPENHSQLDAVNNDYAIAQSNPNVTNFASIELQQAGKAVDDASTAQRQQADSEVVDHLVYVAKQRIEIAQQTAKLKAAEQSIAKIGANRENIRLGLRTAEADAAKQKVLDQQIHADKQDAALVESQAQLEIEKSRIAAQQLKSEAADKRILEMDEKLKELNAKKTDRGMVITLGDVLFDTSKADLKENNTDSVQKLATFFKEYRGRTAVIEGYTDSRGDKAFNQALSEKRANAVRTALLNMGIDSKRVSTRGFGEANPVASNKTAVGRQLNRRVEIVLPDNNVETTPR